MDKHSRKELKTDQFVETVGHSVEFVAGHRRQMLLYIGAGVAAVLLAAVFYFVRQSGHNERQAALAGALRAKEGVIGVGNTPGDPRLSYPTQVDKDRAVKKAFEEVVSRHDGSDEASVAHFQLGILASDAGKMDDAAKQFQEASRMGARDYQSVAKLALAQVLHSQGKVSEAEALLRDIIASPTALVSKEQATITLARVLAGTKAKEARKLLEPLEKDTRPAVARNASQVASELPAN